MHKLFFWSAIIACAFIFIACDAASALWAKTNNKYFFLAIFISPLGYLLFGYINKYSSLSISSGLVNAMVIICTILIGIFYFGDVLKMNQIAGLLAAIFAVILMSF